MPASSKAQFRLMAAAQHNPAFARKVGISPTKAADFTKGVDYGSLRAKAKKRLSHG